MSAARGWGWLGLLALALFIGGMTLGGYLASESGLPEVVGVVLGAGAGYLASRWTLQRVAEARV